MNQKNYRSLDRYGVFVVAMTVFGLATTVSAANLVNNGDFANVGNVYIANTPQGGDDLLTSGGTKIPGWTNVSKFTNELWVAPSNNYNLTASSSNGSGYFVDLTGQGNQKPYGGIEQKIVTVAGMGYTLTFDLGTSTLYNSTGSGAAALTASATGTAVLASKLFSLTPTTTNNWATETLTFIADSDSTTIEFLADSDNTSQYTGLDNVALQTRLLATATALSASPATVAAGAPVALTALVKPAEGTVTPTGQVQFKYGSSVLGSATLNGAGQATFTTSVLAVGQDSVTANYTGDSIHAASTSKAVAVTITPGGPKIVLSPISLAFGNETTGVTSAAKTVQITNTGTAALSLKSIGLSGAQADDFALSKSCGSSLAVKASCTISVTFKPVSTGAKTATISIADNASGSPQAVSLSGTGTTASAGHLTLSPTSLAFGNEAVGVSSAAKSVQVTNSGTTTVSLTSIALTGGQADDFILTKNCGSNLASKATCAISVVFKAVSTGAKAASISITDNAGGSPQAVALSGSGTG